MKDADPINNVLEEDEDLTVKNKKLTVNPDCFIGSIMDYIFGEVGIDEDNRGATGKYVFEIKGDCKRKAIAHLANRGLVKNIKHNYYSK